MSENVERFLVPLRFAAAAGLTTLATAAALWLLLERLGDPAGAAWAGWFAVAAAGVTVAAAAGLSLAASRRRPDA